ncbi:anthranilate synthase, amidotransferase component [Geomicrobium sp. JCM 19037]|nr:anthranilate synthase, amidotransferase component [Geomicrobium sp. JCM 19037]
MLLMIDNYDSFTYNLVQYFGEYGEDCRVFRNDEITLEDMIELGPERLVISPGPCYPDQAGISLKAIEYFSGKIPVLGVCLGHQAIGQVFGGSVKQAPRLMHGKTSSLIHDNKGLYKGIPQNTKIMRYHSLTVDQDTLPDSLLPTAWTEEGELMAFATVSIQQKGCSFTLSQL